MGERNYGEYRGDMGYDRPSTHVLAQCLPKIEIIESGGLYVVRFDIAGTRRVGQASSSFEGVVKEAKFLADFFNVGFTFVKS